MNINIKKLVLIIIVAISVIFVILIVNRKEKNNDRENVTIYDDNVVKEETKNEKIVIEVNGRELDVKLEDNSSAKALLKKLDKGDITIDASDYGNFEKVGQLGFTLPRNDSEITTKTGDLILYEGNKITLYYDTNTWNFTKLGEVTNIDAKELRDILGNGDVTFVIKKVLG